MFWPSKEESERIKHIVHVLFEHHLGMVAARLSLRKALPFHKRIQTGRFEDKDVNPQVVRKIIEELDGSFLKLGQAMSLRPDLIPLEYCEELSKLQDRVQPFPGEQAILEIEAEFHKPISKIFKSFNPKPIAAASMGQVHSAVLNDGKKVAVKVMRPGVKTAMQADIQLLRKLAGVWKKRHPDTFFDPVEIVDEFERYTENELNYMIEARNLRIFSDLFAHSKTIKVPKVYGEYTTSHVLTMEFIEGKKLSDAKTLTSARKKKIICDIIDAEWEQIFMQGMFHADPHPGNFLLMPDGKLGMLDLGIVGRFDEEMKRNMTSLFIKMINGDGEGTVEAAVRLGVANEATDKQQLRRDLYEGLSEHFGIPLKEVRVSKALSGIIHIFRKNKLKISPDFVLFAKTTMTLEGFARRYDPGFNLILQAKPFVERLKQERLDPRNIAKQMKRKMLDTAEFIESIPRKTNALITELDETHHDIDKLQNKVSGMSMEMDRSSNRITLGFLAGTIIIASALAMPYEKTMIFGMPALSFLGYVLALLIILVLFVSMMREKKI